MLINKSLAPPPIAKGWSIKFFMFLTNYAIREGGALDPREIFSGNYSFLPYVALRMRFNQHPLLINTLGVDTRGGPMPNVHVPNVYWTSHYPEWGATPPTPPI